MAKAGHWEPTFSDVTTIGAIVVGVVMWLAPPNWQIGIPVVLGTAGLVVFAAWRYASHALIRLFIAAAVVLGLGYVAIPAIWKSFRNDYPTIAFQWPITTKQTPSATEDRSAAVYTQARLDDAVASGKQVATKLDQTKDELGKAQIDLENLRKSVPKQIADAVAKATQSQTQSDAPTSVDKLPTSVRILLKGPDFEVIDVKNVVSARGIFAWIERKTVLGPPGSAGMSIIVLFKKPITYSQVHIDDHDANIDAPDVTYKSSQYAVLTFDAIFYQGLVDITFVP
jgi:hypothetical protein